MGLSLQNMRDGILRATGTDITDWPNGNVDLDLYLNKSWWDIMDSFDFREKEAAPKTFATVAGTATYLMATIMSPSTFDAIQRVAIEDPTTGEHTTLDLISDYEYENEYVNQSSEQGKPTNYFRLGGNITLYPTPDKIYTIYVYSLITLSDLSVGSPVIPQPWHEIIELGAKVRALYDLDLDDKAEKLNNYYKEKIEGRTPVKAKELSDTKNAGVEVLGREYP